MIVTLTKTQMKIAAGHGRLRTNANRKIKRKDNRTPEFDGLTLDALGVAGELAASIATGIKCTGLFIPVSKLKERSKGRIPDLGVDIEVRTTTKPTYRLMVHKNDPSEWRFVLVRRMKKRVFDVVGWQYGGEVKQEKLWNSTLHYPAYVYPTAWLRPIEELLPDQDKDFKHLHALLEADGYAIIDSTRFDDRIVVVNDKTVGVPSRYAKYIRYTVEELVLLGEVGVSHTVSTPKLQAVHIVKEYLGGVVVR